MPCHLHGLPDSTLSQDAGYDADFCSECFFQQQSLETDVDCHYSYLAEEEHGSRVETGGGAQQRSHDQSDWSQAAYEYEHVSEPQIRDDVDGDSMEACRASDDTSSADTQTFDTPTSSADQREDYTAGFLSAAADAGLEDRIDAADAGGVGQDWTHHCLGLDDPWSTFNRRADRMQALTYAFGYDGHYSNQAEEDHEHESYQAAAPSQSG